MRTLGVVEGSRGGALTPAVFRVGIAFPALQVGFSVFGEMVGAHKLLVAGGAGEALLARVGAQVALQLV